MSAIFGRNRVDHRPSDANALMEKPGAQVSSRRFKEDIHPMEEMSAMLYQLKPVTFRYRKEIDREGTLNNWGLWPRKSP